MPGGRDGDGPGVFVRLLIHGLGSTDRCGVDDGSALFAGCRRCGGGHGGVDGSLVVLIVPADVVCFGGVSRGGLCPGEALELIVMAQGRDGLCPGLGSEQLIGE